jgi:hypothetical protein
LLTYVKVANVVVKRVSIVALKQRLSDKVESIRPATEAAIGRVEAYPASKREDSSVVVTSVVKDKVTSHVLVYAKLL